MGKLPWFKFFPGDWMKDPELRSVSSGARGLWMDMLSLMFECDRRGYLQFNNGKIVNAEHLARMTGCSTDESSRWLQELETAGVFSRTEDGTIYSRRQVREQSERNRTNDRMKKFRGNGGGDPTQWIFIRARILARDNLICGYCGCPATSVDHIVPRSKGGDESDGNLIACCKSCNSTKSDRTPQEAKMEFFSHARVTHGVTPLSEYVSESDFDVGLEERRKPRRAKDQELEMAVQSGSDELIERIARSHPANFRDKGSIQIPQAQLVAVIAAIKRDGPELVEQGTEHYGLAVAKWPLEERKFVLNPVKFWAESHYLKNPQLWERGNHGESRQIQKLQRSYEVIQAAVERRNGNADLGVCEVREGIDSPGSAIVARSLAKSTQRSN